MFSGSIDIKMNLHTESVYKEGEIVNIADYLIKFNSTSRGRIF